MTTSGSASLPKPGREFTGRLNRGVVWASIAEELSHSRNISFEPGRGKKITVTTKGSEEILVVTFNRSGKDQTSLASLVIDASGFDGWWFASLLPSVHQALVTEPDIDKQDDLRRRIANAIVAKFRTVRSAPLPDSGADALPGSRAGLPQPHGFGVDERSCPRSVPALVPRPLIEVYICIYQPDYDD